MDIELWKLLIVQLGMGGVLAGMLMLVLRHLLARNSELMDHLVRVIEVNSAAMSDVRSALEEIRRFMERVDVRLGRVERQVARIEGRLGGGEDGRGEQREF